MNHFCFFGKDYIALRWRQTSNLLQKHTVAQSNTERNSVHKTYILTECLYLFDLLQDKTGVIVIAELLLF